MRRTRTAEMDRGPLSKRAAEVGSITARRISWRYSIRHHPFWLVLIEIQPFRRRQIIEDGYINMAGFSTSPEPAVSCSFWAIMVMIGPRCEGFWTLSPIRERNFNRFCNPVGEKGSL